MREEDQWLIGDYCFCIGDTTENEEVEYHDIMFESIDEMVSFMKVCLRNDIPIMLNKFPEELRVKRV